MAQRTWRADVFQPMSDEYIYCFLEHEQQAIRGEYHAFDHSYLPRLRAQGVQLVNMAVGGERCAQVLYSDTDVHRFWDAHKKLDILNSELEAGCNSFVLCKTADDLARAESEGKIAIIATLAGGRPLEGKANLNLLSSLRSLYRLGLRGLQLTGNGRNRLGDGVAQSRTRGKLTIFGRDVVSECCRLGILLDTAQLSDFGFYDLVELAGGRPVIDSHSCAYEVSAHPRNLSKDRIRTIAQTGGVLGISLRAALVASDKDVVTMDDLVRQIDYCAEVAGIEHIAIGSDYSPFKTPVDREKVIGFGNLGPDICDWDYRTPLQSEKYPGWIDGIWYGIRKNDFVEGVSELETFHNLEGELRARGWSDTDLDLLLGQNLLRVYQEILQ